MSTTTNYYDLLGITIESTQKEIVKAYRKKALSCHPDKNPGNQKAVELFLEISEALKILTDKEARAAFDKVLRAKEAARLRTQAFDAKRKKFKDDLEQRESDAQLLKESDMSNAEKLAAEIKRLREEGSRLLREQQELIRKQVEEEKVKAKDDFDNTPKLKVKWKSSKNDHQNGGYNEGILMTLFQKYGKVTAVVLSKKNGLAIIEYESVLQANMALEFEKGLPDNPITILWLDNKQNSKEKTEVPESTSSPFPQACATSDDFENLVLKKLRQAEEKKRLTKKIIEDDAQEENVEKT